MSSVYEREFLQNVPGKHTWTSGFTDHAMYRLATTRQPQGILQIEANHFKRDLPRPSYQQQHLLLYQLWLEAGKLDKLTVKSASGDENTSFNANLWRNFRNACGLKSDRSGGGGGGTVSEAIATLYPINVPGASFVGKNTLAKYYDQNKRNMFRSEANCEYAKAKVDRERTIQRYLRLKSEMRNPPLDYDGSILPPANFKKYPPPKMATPLATMRDLSLPHNQATKHGSSGEILRPDFHHPVVSTAPVNYVRKPPKMLKKKQHAKKMVQRENPPDYNKVVIDQQIRDVFKRHTNSPK